MHGLHIRCQRAKHKPLRVTSAAQVRSPSSHDEGRSSIIILHYTSLLVYLGHVGCSDQGPPARNVIKLSVLNFVIKYGRLGTKIANKLPRQVFFS